MPRAEAHRSQRKGHTASASPQEACYSPRRPSPEPQHRLSGCVLVPILERMERLMSEPQVFISSSREGLDVAKAIRGLLLQELEGKGDISLWTGKFEFSAAYIESLERASR